MKAEVKKFDFTDGRWLYCLYHIYLFTKEGKITHVLMRDPANNKGRSLTNGVELAIKFALQNGADPQTTRFFQTDDQESMARRMADLCEVKFSMDNDGTPADPGWSAVPEPVRTTILKLFGVDLPTRP